MKKTWVLLIGLLLMLNSMPVYAEYSERELRTLESSYIFDVEVTNVENANLTLKHDLKLDQTLTPDLIDYSFTLDVKYVDGKMLLYNKGELLKNSGLSRDKSMLVFNFIYEVKDSSVSNMAYHIEATVNYDESFQSFDTIVPGRAWLYYIDYKNGEKGYVSLSVAKFKVTKVGSEAQDKATDTPKPLQGKSMAITFVKGLVQVKRAGTDQLIRARRNMQINPGDTVYTGRDSHADIGSEMGEFAISGHDFMMSPLSTFIVPVEEKFDVPKKSRLRVIVDDTLQNAKDMFKNEDEFDIETPSTVMGIRGTDFLVIVDEAGNTEVLLNEGSIYVESKHDGSSVLLKPNQKVTVKMNKPTEKAIELDKADWINFEEIDYDSIPDYYVGLGENDVVEDLLNYIPVKEDKGGSNSFIWIIILLSLLGGFIIVVKVFKKMER